MSYLALYRKYRPSDFDDLVGQNEISTIIKNEILNNKISHAYLFSGPRGTGKTSTAKIIAQMVNCSHLDKEGHICGKCLSCTDKNSVDIIEIDAASNNGVDEIRDLRDKVNLVPSYGKYKVYIIDEVHMLTLQAFNALLKTLEEPPKHIIFILATTEIHRIPETVISRCQKFQFIKFSINDIRNRLREIADLESIDISDDCLYEIARLSDGGMRDAINMLDQLSSFVTKAISISDVYNLNGVISDEELFSFLLFVKNYKINEIVKFLEKIDREGKKIDQFLFDIIDFLKNVLIFMNNSDYRLELDSKNEKMIELASIFKYNEIFDTIFELNELYSTYKKSDFPLILLVSYFISLSNKINEVHVSDVNIDVGKKNDILENDNIDKGNYDSSLNNDKVSDNLFLNDSLKKIRINNTFASASKKKKNFILSKWDDLVKKTSDIQYNSLAGIINDIEILVVGTNYIIFLVKYESLIYRIYNYESDLKKLFFDVFNVDYNFVFLVHDEWIYERKQYISKLKNGFKFVMIEENNGDNTKSDDKKSDSNIDKIVSILGNDIIFYK